MLRSFVRAGVVCLSVALAPTPAHASLYLCSQYDCDLPLQRTRGPVLAADAIPDPVGGHDEWLMWFSPMGSNGVGETFGYAFYAFSQPLFFVSNGTQTTLGLDQVLRGFDITDIGTFYTVWVNSPVWPGRAMLYQGYWNYSFKFGVLPTTWLSLVDAVGVEYSPERVIGVNASGDAVVLDAHRSDLPGPTVRVMYATDDYVPTAIPEPSTLMLLGAGVVLLARRMTPSVS